jgi:hypothetical protein
MMRTSGGESGGRQTSEREVLEHGFEVVYTKRGGQKLGMVNDNIYEGSRDAQYVDRK